MTQRVIMMGECMVELFQLVENVYHQNFAGDVFNTAVYLKRSVGSEAQVQFFSAIGTDLISDKLLRAVQDEKIDTDLLLRTKTARPGLYMINTDCFGERSFVYWRETSAAKQVLQCLQAQQLQASLTATDLFYFSGITLAILSPEDREALFALVKELKTSGCRIGFDPNYRPALWQNPEQARENFIRAYQLADLALPGVDDHKVLFNDVDSAAVLARLVSYGVQEIIVKNGKEGVLALVDGDSFHSPAVQVKKVVDTTAAGDSYNGGYLSARLQGKSPKAACQYAATLAAFVVEHTGAIVAKDKFAEFQTKNPIADF
ncbi:sugar kinase [Rheinheimera sp. SA_1]|uniref:sugar kinase n=1 Tax=Rheinheimera sp. SA_1 TaxID=1827365 RepID=UPI0007FCF51D|nr:sugar kinase [Rheinheimera sp. SA_1]OBP16015.1 sugar kinase [Rheinheimera sp. SA_1]